LRTGESHANADRDSNSNSHSDSNTNSDSNSYAYTDSYAYGHSNGYAYTDSYSYSYSHSYSYSNSYSYAYTDSYAYVDAYGPAETKPDTKATSDTAASPIGTDSEACLAVVRRLPDEGGSSVWRGPERFRGAHAPRDFRTKVLWECDASSHRFQLRSKSRKPREDAHALRRSGSYRTKR
jgi:hypothetical protein